MTRGRHTDVAVLIQHQKAKHFRCPQCPRRLNTAGGLSVHLWQVHKAEPGRLENTLPGRDSFEIEIYGMAGVPEDDLAQWRLRQGSAPGPRDPGMGGTSSNAAKRPKVQNVALTPEQLRAQLEAHKALMASSAAATAPAASPAGGPSSGASTPAAGGAPGAAAPTPPPAVGGAGTPQATPPPAAPPAAPAPPAVHPHKAAVQSGQKSRLAYTDTTLSPDEKMARLPRYAYVEPGESASSGRAPHANGTGPTQTRPPRPLAAELF